jgi:hypothetical protein
MKSERLAFHPRQRQDIEVFSDLPFERNDSSVALFVGVALFVAYLYISVMSDFDDRKRVTENGSVIGDSSG